MSAVIILLAVLVFTTRLILAKKHRLAIEPHAQIVQANGFSLSPASGYLEDLVNSRLLYGGVDTLATVQGVSLLYQFELHDSRYLLITDMDYPFEESAYVTLLNSNIEVMERRDLGNILVLGAEPINSHQLMISYDGERQLTLTVLPRRVWGISHLLSFRIPAQPHSCGNLGRQPGTA